jgi:hypothetical protein
VLEHHAAGFIFRSTDDTPAAEALARWATGIVPAVREAITGRSYGSGQITGRLELRLPTGEELSYQPDGIERLAAHGQVTRARC